MSKLELFSMISVPFMLLLWMPWAFTSLRHSPATGWLKTLTTGACLSLNGLVMAVSDITCEILWSPDTIAGLSPGAIAALSGYLTTVATSWVSSFQNRRVSGLRAVPAGGATTVRHRSTVSMRIVREGL